MQSHLQPSHEGLRGCLKSCKSPALVGTSFEFCRTVKGFPEAWQDGEKATDSSNEDVHATIEYKDLRLEAVSLFMKASISLFNTLDSITFYLLPLSQSNNILQNEVHSSRRPHGRCRHGRPRQ